jgi:hypothetical protein
VSRVYSSDGTAGASHVTAPLVLHTFVALNRFGFSSDSTTGASHVTAPLVFHTPPSPGKSKWGGKGHRAVRTGKRSNRECFEGKWMSSQKAAAI